MSVYFDNAATSFPKPEPVYQAVYHFQRTIGASPGNNEVMEALDVLLNCHEDVNSIYQQVKAVL